MPDTDDILWKLRNTRWQGTDCFATMDDAAKEIETLRETIKTWENAHGMVSRDRDKWQERATRMFWLLPDETTISQIRGEQ